jgi:hypothetical protein
MMMFWMAVGWCVIIGIWVADISEPVAGLIVGFALISVAVAMRSVLGKGRQ